MSEHSISETRLRTIWLFAGLAFLAFAWYGSLVPLAFTPLPVGDAWRHFVDSWPAWQNGSRVDWGVNVMLFIPAGFCLLAAATRFDAPLGMRVIRTLGVAAACLVVSLAIEFSQSWFPPRVPTLADVAAQFCGAVAGLAACWICGAACNQAIAEVAADDRPHSRLGLFLLGYVAALLFFLLAPLDLTLRPADLLHKYRDGRILLVPFVHNYESVWSGASATTANILLFIPVGVFAMTFLTPRHQPLRSVSLSVLLGIAFVLGIELMQLLVLSRYTDAADVVTGSVGVAIGAFGYRRLSGRSAAATTTVQRRQMWLLGGIALYALVPLLILWTPFNFVLEDTATIKQRMSQFFGIPLSSALDGSYLAAFNGFVQKLFLFMPFGGLIAVFVSTLRPAVRSVATLALLALTAGFALLVELGQLLLPSRYASFDDVVICLGGTLVGLWATNRLLA